ncbi:MAG: SCO family protein, partial [Nitratireductor sp.]|nr:SCO family protein [Nitratireductor sp.]
AMLGLLGFILGVASAWMQVEKDASGSSVASIEPAAGNAVDGAKVGGPFSLIDHHGNPVTNESYAGSYKMIFFGFTHCPEICPTELGKMTTVLNTLGDEANMIQPLFITTDPERDDPETMQEYVEQFHPRLFGLTGTPEQIKNKEKTYKVYAAKVQDPNMSEYTMDHSAYTFLMG